MLHNIVVRFDEIKLKFNQSLKLISSKGPKATHESHQYTIVIVHRVHYKECIHNLRTIYSSIIDSHY